MKDIVLIAHFISAFNKTSNNRFTYLASLLSLENDVEIVSTDFNHFTKSHRDEKIDDLSYKVTLLEEPSYKKNISLKRFYCHKKWGDVVYKYLLKRKKPDLIYCAVPSLTVGVKTAKYCKQNNIPFYIDIQDLWPEAFQMVFNIPIISNLLFTPFKKMANMIYCSADEIISVSRTYTDRGLLVNNKVKKGHTVFLGTHLSTFDDNAEKNKVAKDNYIRLGYCGTLGASYDLICVFDALEMIVKRGKIPPKFIVMGDGPRKEEFEKYAIAKKLDVMFTGRMPYNLMCGMLCSCDIVVNPITKGAAQSIINKHADYAASGLPVINTQECKEYRDLVEQYHMGFNCENSNSKEIADRIIELMESEQLRLTMGKNARKCAEEKFDRKNSYNKIVELLMES